MKKITLLRRDYKMNTLGNIFKAEDSVERITYKYWSFLRLPREDGISPVKLLFAKSKVPKLVKFPKSSGISPVMRFPDNSLHDE